MSDPGGRRRIDLSISAALALVALLLFTAVAFGQRAASLGAAATGFLLLAVGIARKAPGLGRLRHSDLVPAGVFLALVLALTIRGAAITVDGPLLYMQVRSLVIDRDLDYTNEYRDLVPAHYQLPLAWRRAGPPNPNAAEPGPALLWMPFFVAAHLLVLAARRLGAGIAADGYSAPYVAAVCFGNAVWAFLGVVLSARIARRWFPPGVAAVCAAAAWLATPLVWYTVVEATMPHATATFAVALFLWRWLRVRDRPDSRGAWLLLAFSAGLLLSMERYDGYFLVCPLVTLLGLAAHRRPLGPAWRRLVTQGLAPAAVFLLTIIPLLYANLSSSHHSVLGESDLFGFTLGNWAHPHLVELLFSSRNGLFSWTPVAYLGVVGLALFARRDRRTAGTLLLALALGAYLLAASYDWSGEWAFGSRRFTEALPVFVLGLCTLAAAVLARPAVLATLCLGGLVAWNLTLAAAVMRGEIPRDANVSFGDAASGGVRQAYGHVGNPWAAPASWIFALRYGVTPEAFDRIVGRAPVEAVTAHAGMDAEADVVGAGWCGRDNGRCPAATLWSGWSEGERSTLLFVLTAPIDRRLSLAGEAASYPTGTAQTIFVAVNGTPVGKWSLPPRLEARDFDVPATVWKAGLNEVEFHYAWALEGPGPRLAWRLAAVSVRSRNDVPRPVAEGVKRE